MAWSSVAGCRIVFLSAGVSVRYFGTSADMSGQFSTGAKVSYGHFGTSVEMSWGKTDANHLTMFVFYQRRNTRRTGLMLIVWNFKGVKAL